MGRRIDSRWIGLLRQLVRSSAACIRLVNQRRRGLWSCRPRCIHAIRDLPPAPDLKAPNITNLDVERVGNVSTKNVNLLRSKPKAFLRKKTTSKKRTETLFEASVRKNQKYTSTVKTGMTFTGKTLEGAKKVYGYQDQIYKDDFLLDKYEYQIDQ